MLSHYPANRREEGRFRKISVRVSNPKAGGPKAGDSKMIVSAPRGYYGPQPFKRLSKLDRSIELHAALRGDISPDFPVTATVNFFAAPDGTTVLVLSSGVAPGDLEARPKGADANFDLTVVSRIRPEASEALPTWSSRKIHKKIPRTTLAERVHDPTFLLSHTDGVPLQPGRHQVRLLVRDERSGRMGVFRDDGRGAELSRAFQSERPYTERPTPEPRRSAL